MLNLQSITRTQPGCVRSTFPLVNSSYSTPFGTLALPHPHPACRLIVTVPAKDEAGFITTTLDALRRQTDPAGRPLPPATYEVIILANNCSDATAAVIRDYAATFPHFRVHVAERHFPRELACVGTARRLLMDTARARFIHLGVPHGIICTTDADTLPDPTWVHHTLAAAARGARAIGGRILVPHAEPRQPHYRKQHLQDVTYRSLQYCLESMIDPQTADPWPRHFQHFGPSTAVRADVYTACGGIPPLRSLEDVGLAMALERIGVPITHDPRVRVTTSARVSERVGGRCFSSQLSEWSELEERGDTQRVIGLANCKKLFKWKVALRRASARRSAAGCPRLAEMLPVLGWRAPHLEYQLANQSFGGLYQGIRRRLEADKNFAGEPIGRAIHDLRRFSHGFRHRAVGTRPAGTALPA